MPVKYYCPKCAKRYVEWGAEKLKFECPACANEELLRVSSDNQPKVSKRPNLRRSSNAQQDEVALLKSKLGLKQA